MARFGQRVRLLWYNAPSVLSVQARVDPAPDVRFLCTAGIGARTSLLSSQWPMALIGRGRNAGRMSVWQV